MITSAIKKQTSVFYFITDKKKEKGKQFYYLTYIADVSGLTNGSFICELSESNSIN